MLKYSGKISLDEHYTNLLNISREFICFIENIFGMNNQSCMNFSMAIDDPETVSLLKALSDDREKIELLKKIGKVDEYYLKMIFNHLILDFSQYMYESLKNVFEVKPQIGFTLARRPMIDNLFYLQLLYKDPKLALSYVFSENPMEKDVGTRENKQLDEEISNHILNESCLGKLFNDNIYYKLRYSCEEGLMHYCNKAIHIVTSHSKFNKTASGELNFIFMQDDEILYLTQKYLDIISLLLPYSSRLILDINNKLYGKNDGVESELRTLEEKYLQILVEGQIYHIIKTIENFAELSEDEKIEIIAKRILAEHKKHLKNLKTE